MHARSDAQRPLWSVTATSEGRLSGGPTPVADSEKHGLRTAQNGSHVAARPKPARRAGGDPDGAPGHDKAPGADALGALSFCDLL